MICVQRSTGRRASVTSRPNGAAQYPLRVLAFSIQIDSIQMFIVFYTVHWLFFTRPFVGLFFLDGLA